MKAETQKIILDTVSRVFSSVATALGKESFSYEEGIQFISNYGDKTLFEMFLKFIAKIVPVTGQRMVLTPEIFPSFLSAMDTREKAEKILIELPEPDPKKLEKILREVSLFLPSIRQILLPFAEQLPPPPGGAPRKIPESEEPKVREEVALLFNQGYAFPKAKEIVARRRRVSLSTIQRICRKGTTQIENSELTGRD